MTIGTQDMKDVVARAFKKGVIEGKRLATIEKDCREIRIMTKLKHYKNEAGDSVSEYGPFIFNQGDEELESLKWGFGDGYEPDILCTNVYSFLGCCFHLMQQCGGNLYYQGKEVRAVNIEDTCGAELQEECEIKFGEMKLKISELLNR